MTCPLLAKVARCLACLAVLIGTGCEVQAAVTKSALEQVGVAPHLNDLLPLQLPLSDGSTSRPLLQWLGAKPTVWIFADYNRCRSRAVLGVGAAWPPTYSRQNQSSSSAVTRSTWP